MICSSVIVDLGLEVRDPGLVPNGVRCGEQKMCIDQRCVPVKAELCESNCYGNGVCTSDGGCHCAPGYYAPYCKHWLGSRILLGIYILFLGVLPALALVAGVWLFFQERFKTWWIIRTRKTLIRSRLKQSTARGRASIRSQSMRRNIKFNVDLKSVEISQPMPMPGQAPTAAGHLHPVQQMQERQLQQVQLDPVDTAAVLSSSESVRMKPIRPAPPPPRPPAPSTSR